jgi:membrane-associated protein
MGLTDFILHLDKYIGSMIDTYGTFTYLILFIVIFLETGIVLAPFLPGDSLLFIVGTFAANGYLDIILLFVILSLAAILGDSANYWLGNAFGEKIFSKSRFFKKEYLEKTKKFYEKHGGKTIILSRFIPIIRTFAPFVAGIGKMSYTRFFAFNVIGGITWVALFLLGGYFFGTLPFVQENLTIIVLVIIIASLIPAVTEYLKHRKSPLENNP